MSSTRDALSSIDLPLSSFILQQLTSSTRTLQIQIQLDNTLSFKQTVSISHTPSSSQLSSSQSSSSSSTSLITATDLSDLKLSNPHPNPTHPPTQLTSPPPSTKNVSRRPHLHPHLLRSRLHLRHQHRGASNRRRAWYVSSPAPSPSSSPPHSYLPLTLSPHQAPQATAAASCSFLHPSHHTSRISTSTTRSDNLRQ